MSKQFCEECCAELSKDEIEQIGCFCSSCEYVEADVTRKPKRSKQKFDGPGPNEKWEKVPSPYKAYKDGV